VTSGATAIARGATTGGLVAITDGVATIGLLMITIGVVAPTVLTDDPPPARPVFSGKRLIAATKGAKGTATGSVAMVVLLGAPLFCTIPAATRVVASGTGTTLTDAAAGDVTAAATTGLVDPTFVSELLGLELISTGPLAPATTAPIG